MANTKIPVELSSTPSIVDNGNATAITIDSSENVGIGTDSPNALLHIKTEDPATNQAVIDFRNPTYGIFAQTNSISAKGNTLEFIATDYNNNSPTTHNVLTMRPEGNVGIGTDSPSNKLTVASASFEDHILLERTGVGSMHITATNPHGLAFTDGTTQFFTLVQSTGNIGIGTNNPPSPLSIFGAGVSSPTASNAQESYDNALFRINNFSNSSVGLSIGSTGSNVTHIQTSYNEGTTSPLTLNPFGGNVGIGTDNPSEKLHVAGTIRSEAQEVDYAARYSIASGTYTAGTFYDFTDRSTIQALGYGNGIYVFKVYDDTFGGGGGNYFVHYLSEPFYFHNTGSNAGGAFEFTMGSIPMGHAANGFPGGNQIRIRMLEQYGGAPHKFQWSPGSSNLTIDGNAGKRIEIDLFRYA